MPKVMLVDDEVVITMQLEQRLTAMGYEVVGTAASGDDAREMAKGIRPDLILMDIVMPGKLDGIAAAEIIKTETDIPVIFLTAYTEENLIQRAKYVEPLGYIVKPFEERELKAAIEVALYKKQIERRLQQSEQRFRTVADFTYDWEYWIGSDGRYIYVSPSCERITGYDVNEFLEDPELLERITHSDDRSIVAGDIQIELESDEVYHIDFRIITRSGEQRWISHFCQPVKGAGGLVLGTRASNRDITERKQMEQERLDREKLQSVIEISGAVYHELNQPMHVISGYAELLMGDILKDNPLCGHVEEIKNHVVKMAHITKKLGRITRYETRDYIEGRRIIDINKASDAPK